MNLKDYKCKFNYHTHTWRNGHGNQQASDEEYIQAAIKQGIKVLGFSEHCPYKGENNQTFVRPNYEQIPEYLQTLKSLKAKYQGQCDILIGFECEYFPDKLAEYKELAKIADYLILGQHFKTWTKDYRPVYCITCNDETAKEYTNFVLSGLDSGLYTYLAHPDYFFGGAQEINETFIECAKKICQKCADLKIPMEINLRGSSKDLQKKKYLNGGEHYTYPNRLFWEIAKEHDIQCVVGIDAHDPYFIENIDFSKERVACEVDNLNLKIITEPFIKHKI